MTEHATASIRRINPPDLGTPPGFSNVVDVSATRLIFISGQAALEFAYAKGATGRGATVPLPTSGPLEARAPSPDRVTGVATRLPPRRERHDSLSIVA